MRDKRSSNKRDASFTKLKVHREARSHKAQSATEYIATYGWAVLIIVIMIAVLYFFVLAPSTSAPEVCLISSQDFYCQSFVFGSNSSFSSIGVVLTNSRQYAIKDPSLSLNTSVGLFPIPCTPNFVLPGGTVICNATFSNTVVNPGVLVSGSLTINATICTNLNPTEKNCIASPVQSTSGRFQTHSTQTFTKPKISLSLLVGNASQLATGAGDNLTAVVTFFGVPIAGATVNFTYSSPITATIKPVLSTTDTNGNAYSTISTTENGVVTVYAQYGNVIASNTITFEKPAYVTYYSSNLIGSTSDVLTVDGIQYTYSQLPKTFEYAMGSSHTYAYSSPVSGSTGTNYIYDTINGCGGSSQSGTVTAEYNCTLFAVYTTQYSLTMASGSLSPTSQPSGATTTPTPGSYWYNSGSQAKILASNTLAPNWIFDRWSCTGTDCYSGTSESATISISSPTTETAYFYSVLTQPTLSPSTQTIDKGQTATITATMPDTGITPYSYTWLANFNGSTYGSASECSQPSGSATASQQVQCSFNAGNTISTGTYDFYIKITDSSPALQTSSSSTVSVVVNPALQTSYIAPSSPVTIDYGQSQQVNITASGGTPPYTYSWTSTVTNGSCSAPTGLGTSASFTFTPTTSDEGCTFTFTGTVKDSVNSAVSSTTAGITVNKPLSLTSPISPSSPVTIDYGQSTPVIMNVSGGTLPYTYSWVSNVIFGSCSAPTGLGTSSYFTFTPTTSDEGCTFTFTGTARDNVGETVSGTSAGITVNPQPSVSISPTSSTMLQGQATTLSSSISGGTSPYTYQWYNDTSGSGIAISGGTSPTYTVSGGSTGTFTYYITIKDNVGETATSSISTITVNPVTTTSTTSTTTTTTSSTASTTSSGSTTTMLYCSYTASQYNGPNTGYSAPQLTLFTNPTCTSEYSQTTGEPPSGYSYGTCYPDTGSACSGSLANIACTDQVYNCNQGNPYYDWTCVQLPGGPAPECNSAGTSPQTDYPNCQCYQGTYYDCSGSYLCSSTSTSTSTTTTGTSTSTSSTTTTISYAVLVGGPCSLSSTCTSTGLDCNTGYDCTDGIDTGSCSNSPSPCN